MFEYYPWSKKVLEFCVDEHKKGRIPAIDLELTAKCSGANCIYCDSKPDVSSCVPKGENDFISIKNVILEAKKHGLKWVYTCGLGEPLEDENFWNLIHLLKANEIKLSMFSNGVFVKDIHIAKELLENDVNIILKMDTFEEENFDKILGLKGTAKKIYAARDYLLEAGYGETDGYTNLAFSIVPTKLSITGIPQVISYCKKYGIFASIGELEQAGEVISKNLNELLSIEQSDIEIIKKFADEYIEGNYMRPICPCILSGIHIDNRGNCVVDEETGLNCKWFLLNQPCITHIGNIKENNITDLLNSVVEYRQKCFKNNIKQIKKMCGISYTFGGCGGNPKDIIDLVYSQQ